MKFRARVVATEDCYPRLVLLGENKDVSILTHVGSRLGKRFVSFPKILHHFAHDDVLDITIKKVKQ